MPPQLEAIKRGFIHSMVLAAYKKRTATTTMLRGPQHQNSQHTFPSKTVDWTYVSEICPECVIANTVATVG